MEESLGIQRGRSKYYFKTRLKIYALYDKKKLKNQIVNIKSS